MGNKNYKSINHILYEVEIDNGLFLGICAKDNDIYEIIRIGNIVKSKLISCTVTSTCLIYKFKKDIILKVYKDSKNTYSLDYDKIQIFNTLLKIKPINYFSENIDKIYYLIQDNTNFH